MTELCNNQETIECHECSYVCRFKTLVIDNEIRIPVESKPNTIILAKSKQDFIHDLTFNPKQTKRNEVFKISNDMYEKSSLLTRNINF